MFERSPKTISLWGFLRLSVKSSLQIVWICSKTLSLSWKWNIHTRLNFLEFLRISCFPKLLNMYVCLKSSCFIMENAQTSTQNTSYSRTEIKLYKIKENATPIEESSCWIITNQRKRYPYRGIVVCIFVYVWRGVQNPSACHAFCNSNITRGSEGHRFFKFSKRYRSRYYINTSIHTYPVFARRINIWW